MPECAASSVLNFMLQNYLKWIWRLDSNPPNISINTLWVASMDALIWSWVKNVCRKCLFSSKPFHFYRKLVVYYEYFFFIWMKKLLKAFMKTIQKKIPLFFTSSVRHWGTQFVSSKFQSAHLLGRQFRDSLRITVWLTLWSISFQKLVEYTRPQIYMS